MSPDDSKMLNLIESDVNANALTIEWNAVGKKRNNHLEPFKYTGETVEVIK